jgi:hypothetical protein
MSKVPFKSDHAFNVSSITFSFADNAFSWAFEGQPDGFVLEVVLFD